jgi:hypothetical protein
MWEDSGYCWVVICKNYWHHMKQNLFHGQEYVYKPSEVFRYEQEPPERFTPHPLFQEET